MISRRQWLRITAGTGAAFALGGYLPYINSRILTREASAQSNATVGSGEMILRSIPSSGETIPVIGLGGRWISARSSSEELENHRAVLHALADGAEASGRVFDTAADYGRGGSEEYAGQWAEEDSFADNIFWATKVNVVGRGGGKADPDDVREMIERSFRRLRVPVIDLIQVHNMGDPATQLGILQEYKDAGRIRYIGITTTSERQYPALARVMQDYLIDFVGIDYAVDNRIAEELIFPVARDRGIATMVYLPFGRSRMWARIGDRPVPSWAVDFDATTWAQFMLKFVLAHPDVTVVAPGTSKPIHMIDNLNGGRGRLPTEEHLRRMIALVESLPDE
jgi:aryl-alcohol dehydrogenase-like predicted oxidoreductase